LRQQSWDNLEILNEWKRRYPKQDPIKLHEQFFQTKLLDPAGGQYVWNEKYESMESTMYGCPAQPKAGPAELNVLTGLRHGNFGITFEPQGLRARAEVER